VAITNFNVPLTHDLAGVPRPLDGNNDGLANFDIGAYELLLEAADSNSDGIPDGWTWKHGLNPTHPDLALGNPDGDAHTTSQEWVADTDPTSALSILRIAAILPGPQATLDYLSSSNRQYTLMCATNLADGSVWENVPGQVDVAGSGSLDSLTDTNEAAGRFYRVSVRVP
jgi:hypothetical protein